MKKRLIRVIIYMSACAIWGFMISFISATALMAGNTSAQSVKEVVITVEFEEATLRETLEEIEAKTIFKFLYNKPAVEFCKSRVSTPRKTATVEEILHDISKQTSAGFRQIDNTIAVQYSGKYALNEDKSLVADSIAGKVTDASSGEPLPGVNIVVKGTTTGTSTDQNGDYKLTVSSLQDTLVFMYIGYQQQEVPINGRFELDVQLTPEAIMGEEMVVTGYTGEINRREVTGAVSTVDVSNFSQRKVYNATEALQGQVAGVQVSRSTGAPGDEVQIRIRGEGTIGNNNPLFVIDGVPTRDMSYLNPSDIKSMDVLKDAASAAMYGSRASGGVIIVETKQGTEGEPSFNASYYGGMSNVTNLPEMLNAEQYMNTVEQAWNNAGYSGANPYTADKGRSDFVDTSWLDQIFGAGYTHNFYLSASGENENTNYHISSRFYTEDGVVVYGNDKIDLINFRANINTDITDRFKIGTNTQLTHTNEDNLNSRGESPGIVRHAMLRPPIIPVMKDESDPYYSEADPFTDLPFYTGPNSYESNKYELTQNPVALASFSDDVITEYRAFGNVFGEYNFLRDKNLKFRTNFGIDVLFYHQKVFNENFGDDDGGGQPQDQGLGRINRPNSISESREEAINLTWSNTLNYNNRFGDHGVKGLLGTEFVSNNFTNLSASRNRFDFTSGNFRYLNFGDTESGLTNGGTGSEWTLFSYFGSATYDFDKKYIFTANLRADASSKFAENYNWGYFPSFSAGWIISEENFMDDINWLSLLKLRGSWGQLGNQEIPNYAYLTLLERNSVGQYEVTRYGNPNLRWETSTQANVGFDIFLNNNLSLSAEYFNMLTSDILLPITLPEVVGEVSPTYVNSGEVRNSGFEFNVSYESYKNDFKYRISANFATLNNEVEKLHSNLPNIVGQVTRTQPGYPINAYYGYVMEGIYQNEEEISLHLHSQSDPSALPGDIKFKDLDGNGAIDSNDRQVIGSPHQDFTFGFNLAGEYRSFDFSVFLQGVQGIDRYNDGKQILDYDTRPFNYTTRVLDSWNGEGTSNSIPRVSFTDNGSSRISDVYVEDASYLRLKNIELGYSLKSLMRGNIALNDVRIFVSGQNLFTVTNYTGLDPETTDLMDYGTYPQSRMFVLGINASF